MELKADMEYFLAEFNFENTIIEECTVPGAESLVLPGARFCWRLSSPLVNIQRYSDWTVFLWGAPRLKTSEFDNRNLAHEMAVSLAQGGSLLFDLRNLEGYFAVLAWNEKERQLLIATDPIGMTKVYYAENQGRIIVSSHAHLAAKRLGDLAVSSQGLSILFSLKGIPAPYTVFQAVSVLKPAEFLIISGHGRHSEEYWRIPDQVTPFEGSMADAEEQLEHLLEDTLHRIAATNHNTVGISMSSGVDSALLAAMLVQAGIPAQGLTVGYDPLTRNDETQAASENAGRIGLPIDVLRVIDKDITDILNFATKSFPEPLGDATILPQLLMTMAARDKVSSIIDGTGADNIFGGMQKFSLERYAHQYLKVPRFLRAGVIRPVLNLLPSSRKSAFTDQVRKMQKFSYGVELPEQLQQVYWSRFMTKETVENIINPTLLPDGQLVDRILLGIRDQVPAGFDDFFVSTYASIRGTLPTHATQKLVSMQYASGIPYHTPFLTPGMIEFALSLPPSFKLAGGESKLVLRRAALKVLPVECTNQKKATFSPPIGRWLLGVFHAEFMDLLRNNDFFNTIEIEKMLADQSSGWRDWQWELWLVFIFLKWFKETTG